MEIELVVKSLIATIISEKYGVKKYLSPKYFDPNADINSVKNLVFQIGEELEKNYGKHLAITHYKDKYDFIPPFVLVKVLTMGQISRYYGLLKQEDRQKISKYFKLSDKLLKQILLNITLIRNFSAHNNRLYTFHSKFGIGFKSIDCTYQMNDRSTNLYMIMKCMELLLDETKCKQFIKQVNSEVNKLSKKLKVINIKCILNTMGVPNE